MLGAFRSLYFAGFGWLWLETLSLSGLAGLGFLKLAKHTPRNASNGALWVVGKEGAKGVRAPLGRF